MNVEESRWRTFFVIAWGGGLLEADLLRDTVCLAENWPAWPVDAGQRGKTIARERAQMALPRRTCVLLMGERYCSVLRNRPSEKMNNTDPITASARNCGQTTERPAPR